MGMRGGGGPRFAGPVGPSGAPSNMVCISQGTSGKQCAHFSSGNCTYGPKCIHMHMVPSGPSAAPKPAKPKNVKEGDDSDEDEDEGEGAEPDDDPLQTISQKRDEAKRRAYAEALEAAKITAKSANDLDLSGLRGPDKGNMKGITNLPVIEGGLLHAYSVGQKGKKKDKPPEEQRPGDWLCVCENYNFSWRKTCNACGSKKPLNEMEEKAKQDELKRIKEERAKRLKNQERDADLRKIAEREERRGGKDRDRGSRDRDRDRDRGRDRGGRDRDRGRDRGRGGGDDENPNMVPIGGDRRSRDDRGSRDDKDDRRDDRRSKRDDDDSSSHKRYYDDDDDKRRSDKKKSRRDDDDDDDDRNHRKSKKSHRSRDSDDDDDRSSKKKKRDRSRSRSRSRRKDRSRSKKRDRSREQKPADL